MDEVRRSICVFQIIPLTSFPQNVQYLLLAFFWWSSKPITSESSLCLSACLLKLSISHFTPIHHLLVVPCPYVYAHDLDVPIPSPGSTRYCWWPSYTSPIRKEAPSLGQRYAHKVDRRCHANTSPLANYDTAMRAVAFTEILILVRVVLGALVFKNSLLSPIVFVHFLRQRYYQSAFTRDAFAVTDARINALITQQGNPTLTNVWTQARGLITRWAGSNLAPAAAAAPAQ